MVGWQQLRLVVGFCNFVPRYERGWRIDERCSSRGTPSEITSSETDARYSVAVRSRRVVTKDRQRILFLSGRKKIYEMGRPSINCSPWCDR